MKFQPYEKYKESDIEWLGQVPQSWIVTKLKRYGKFKGGSGFPIEHQGYENLEIPFYKVNSLAKDIKYLIKSPDTISIETSENLGAFRFPVNSIFFAKVGAALLLSRIRKNLEVCCIDNNMMGFIPNSNLDSDFAYYLLQQIKFDFLVNSGAIPSVNDSQISRYQLVFPSLDEQINIANYLNKETFRIDILISKQEQLIKLLEEQRKSIISHAVTKGLNPNAAMKDSGIEWLNEVPEHWDLKRLDSAAKIIRGNSSFSKDDLLENGEYVALQYGKTYKVDEIDENFSFYVNHEFYKETQVAQSGDVILVSTSETIEDLGHSCLYTRNEIGLIGGEQFLLKPNREIVVGKYLYYATKAFSKSLQIYATGTKVFRFNSQILKTVYIPSISLSEQQKIINYLDDRCSKIDLLVSKQKKLIEKLKEYRTSIISHAVTGKIDVREAL